MRSAAFMTVAFSRSSRPMEPISWLSDTGMSPSSSRTTSAAARSWRSETDANTLVTATASALPATRLRNRRSSSTPSGTISRPSNSRPPGTMASPTEIASRRSAGQS